MDETLRNSPAHKTYFSAACTADRSSMGGEYFDPFALSWISAINGKGLIVDRFSVTQILITTTEYL